MPSIVNDILLYLPIGVIGLWRWSVWGVKKIVARRYKPTPANGYMDTLSVVIPVYNEEPELFVECLESILANEPDEMIAVVDHSDTTCVELFKEFQQRHDGFGTLIVTERPGKREALADGIRVAKGNIIALVDSDTIWDPNIKGILMAPFADPTVGGVGPRQDVSVPDTLARRLFNIHLDHRYFDEMTYLAVVGDAITCISGRTAVYRASAIAHQCDALESETFFGKKSISGDDKCLTRLVQEEGWKVRYQANARVLTPGAPELGTLLKQQIRWMRNTYRSDIVTLMSPWVWKREKLLAFHMIDRFTVPFTLVLSPIYFVLSLVWGDWWVAVILLVWWHASRGFKMYPHLKHSPKDTLILPLYIATTYYMAVMKIYAMFSIGRQGWITRWDKSRSGSGMTTILHAFKSRVPHVATGAAVMFLGFVVVQYKDVATIVPLSGMSGVSAAEEVGSPYLSREELQAASETHKRPIIAEAEAESAKYAYYAVQKRDTLSGLALRYNGNVEDLIEVNAETVRDANTILPGQMIAFPLGRLHDGVSSDGETPPAVANVTYDAERNTVVVSGLGRLMTIPALYLALNDDTLLERGGNGEWILRAHVEIQKGAFLIIDGQDVTWLKLKSDDAGFIAIQSKDGSILIQGARITSWDEGQQAYDRITEDGRSFIVARNSGRMDIIDSELAFLGYGYHATPTMREPTGGSYGVSWKLSGSTLGEDFMTGRVTGSVFHDNYFGIYTYGVTGMEFTRNEMHRNIVHGMNLQESSHDVKIAENAIHDNGSHGILVAKRGHRTVIVENEVYSNDGYGILLHTDANMNVVERNAIYGNVGGVVVSGGHDNLIERNEIRRNGVGVRASYGASGNHVEDNVISENDKGMVLSGNATGNYIVDNSFTYNDQRITAKESIGNFIQADESTEYETYD